MNRSLSGSVSIMSEGIGRIDFFFVRGLLTVGEPPFSCLSTKSSQFNRGETTLAVIKSRFLSVLGENRAGKTALHQSDSSPQRDWPLRQFFWIGNVRLRNTPN